MNVCVFYRFFWKVLTMLPLFWFAIFVIKTYINTICYVMHFDKFGLHIMVIIFYWFWISTSIMVKFRSRYLSKVLKHDISAQKMAMWARGRWQNGYHNFNFSWNVLGNALISLLYFVVKVQCIMKFRPHSFWI